MSGMAEVNIQSPKLRYEKMLKTRDFGGVVFNLLPTPVEAIVKPDNATRLANVPSSRLINVVGYRKKDKLVLFARPGETDPIDRLYEGHIEDPPEDWMMS